MIKFMKPIFFKMGILGCVLLIALNSCEVETIEPAKPLPETEEPTSEKPAPEEPEKPAPPEKNDTLEMIGTGSGNLVIKDVEGKKYSIKPGTYSSFHL